MFKWEQERVNTEKLAKSIALFGDQNQEVMSRVSTRLPNLKGKQKPSTRLTKRRIENDYRLKYSDLMKEKLKHKRARTTRKSRRARTIDREDDSGPVDFSKVCKISKDRVILHTSAKQIGVGTYEIEFSEHLDSFNI